MPNVLSYDDLNQKSAGVKAIKQMFARAGTMVVSTDADLKPKRSSGITYKDLLLSFADNQKATLSVKQSGDIFQVKINGSVLPIKNQDDTVKAVGEMVKALDGGRAAFQKRLARVKTVMPKGIRSTVTKQVDVLQSRSVDLDKAIAEATAKRDALKVELGILDSVNLTDEDIAVAKKNADTLTVIGEKSGWDGDMPSKAGRDELVEAGMVDRYVTDAEQDCNVLNAKGKAALAAIKTLDSIDDVALIQGVENEPDPVDQAVTFERGDTVKNAEGKTGIVLQVDAEEVKVDAGQGADEWRRDEITLVSRGNPEPTLDAAKKPNASKVHALIAKDFELDEENSALLEKADIAEGRGKDKEADKLKSQAKSVGAKQAANAKKIAELAKNFTEDEWDKIISSVPYGGKMHNTSDIWNLDNLRDDGYLGALDAALSIEKGTIVKINGLPFEATDNTVVEGLPENLALALDDTATVANEDELLQLWVDVGNKEYDDAFKVLDGLLRGQVLDSATHAVATLQISLEIAENNYPIQMAEGRLDQAELTKRCAASFRDAIKQLSA